MPVVVGEAAPETGEVRVERCGVAVALVDVATGRIGLPHLDAPAPHGVSAAVDDAAPDGDPLADRFPRVLEGEVGFQG